MRLSIVLLGIGLLSACSSQPSNSGGSDVAPAPSLAPLACAKASYYSDSLAGNSTASGKPYDPSKLTAAHRRLDFGTKLRVTREGHGEVVVTVNDREPFIDGRVIDLSRAAAEKIDILTDGVVDVCIYPAN